MRRLWPGPDDTGGRWFDICPRPPPIGRGELNGFAGGCTPFDIDDVGGGAPLFGGVNVFVDSGGGELRVAARIDCDARRCAGGGANDERSSSGGVREPGPPFGAMEKERDVRGLRPRPRPAC